MKETLVFRAAVPRRRFGLVPTVAAVRAFAWRVRWLSGRICVITARCTFCVRRRLAVILWGRPFGAFAAFGGDGGNRQTRGGESRMEIETAGRTIDVHEFTREEEAWNAFAFHGLRIDFMEGDSADGDDGFLHRADFRDIQRKPLQKLRWIVVWRGMREHVAEGRRDVQFVQSVGE